MADTPGYETLIADAANDPRELVAVARDGRVATVTLSDPRSLNALSAPLTVQLRAALETLARDPAVGVIVLTGTDPAFSAGGDVRLMTRAQSILAEGAEGAAGLWRWIRYQFGGIARLIAQTDKPFVAAVNGAAAGVGLAFALASDLILVSERARLLTAFGNIGLIPEVGTGWILTRRLGYHRAFELYVSGRELSGTEAAAIGLANHVVPHERLLPEARAWADRLLALPDPLVALTKPLLRRTADLSWEQAIAMEEFAEPMCFTTAAHRDAVARFLGTHGKRG
jgi:2-(1,2-epoxy-1,2-dihydrophenyl)acetyl-CoA isomerase